MAGIGSDAGAATRLTALRAVMAASILSTAVHYVYGGASRLEAWRHVSICLDGLTGLAVVTFVAWSWRSLHRGSAARLAAG